MADIPFLVGANAQFRLFMGSAAAPGNPQEVIAYAKTWKIKPNVSKINDGIGGEDRDRLNRVVNYFDLSLECAIKDALLINALLADILNDDSSLAPTAKAAGVKMKIRDGSKAAYVLREFMMDEFEIGQGGRDKTMMNNISARFRYLDKGPAV